MCSCAFASSCYGAVQSLSGDAERDVAVEAVGQGECSLYNEDTVTDEEGRFRLRGLLVREGFKPWGGLNYPILQMQKHCDLTSLNIECRWYLRQA